MNTEIKVGLLFFIGIGTIGYFTFMTTSLGRPKGDLAVNFPRIARLKEGDAVTYNGVRVGTITEVKPVLDGGNPAVQLGFAVQPDLRPNVLIGNKSRFRIDQGVLGGATLEIMSDGGQPISPELLKGKRGEEPTSISDVMTLIQKVIEENRDNLKGAIASAKDAMERFGKASTEIQETVAENRAEVKQAIVNFKDMGDRVTKLVDENREGVKAAVERVEQASREIRDAVAENRPALKQTIDKAPKAVDNLNDAGVQIAGAGKEIKETVAENRADVRSAIQDVKNATPKIERTADNLATITDQIASGKGTIGKLVFEDTLHEKAVGTLDSIKQRSEEVKPVTQGFSELKFVLGVEGGQDVRTGAGEGDVYLRVEPRPYKFYEAGVVYRTAPRDRDTLVDDPNKLSIDFNLLIGWRWFPDDNAQLYRLTTAAGLISTKPGVFVSTAFTKSWGLYALARQKDYTREPDDRRYEEGHVMVRSCVYYAPVSWIHLQAGVNDIIDHPGAWFGLRVDVLDNDLRNLTSVSSLMR
jgi:ABC-type transporter Mla subunit MlaD